MSTQLLFKKKTKFGIQPCPVFRNPTHADLMRCFRDVDDKRKFVIYAVSREQNIYIGDAFLFLHQDFLEIVENTREGEVICAGVLWKESNLIKLVAPQFFYVNHKKSTEKTTYQFLSELKYFRIMVASHKFMCIDGLNKEVKVKRKKLSV